MQMQDADNQQKKRILPVGTDSRDRLPIKF